MNEWIEADKQKPEIPFVYIDEFNNYPRICYSLFVAKQSGKIVYYDAEELTLCEKSGLKFGMIPMAIKYWLPLPESPMNRKKVY